MCLQWCHVRSWLIDNDLPCTGCDRGDANLLPGTWSCATCQHQRTPAGAAPICGLTCETQPLIDRCCHWQAQPLADHTMLRLADTDVAPWLPDDVISLFAASSSAPDVSQEADRVVVALRDLSVPLLYGVPAEDWDAALGWDTARAATGTADVPAQAVQDAITDALTALEQSPLEGELALTQLMQVLTDTPKLPTDWQQLITQILTIGRDLHRQHAPMMAQIARLETVPCMLP